MTLSTNTVVVATKSFDDAGRSTTAIANDIESTWNNNHKYQMTVDTTYHVIDISGYNHSSAGDALTASKNEIMSSHAALPVSFDAILVRDNRDYSNPSGVATSGYPNATKDHEQYAAGSSDRSCIGYCTDAWSSHLEAHEVGHMYGGDHDRHMTYGYLEHTVMGNSGDPTCIGGNSSNRTRTNVWSVCSESDIETYMEYWNSKNGAFE